MRCSLPVQEELQVPSSLHQGSLHMLLQELKRADAVLERALYDAEDIDMDSVFLAIDGYRNSILLTRCGTCQWAVKELGWGCRSGL